MPPLLASIYRFFHPFDNRKFARVRRAVLKRHDNRCAVTGQKLRRLDVHHLYDKTHYPHLQYDPDNLIPLAPQIHKAFHILFMGSYSARCTPEDFALFLSTITLKDGKITHMKTRSAALATKRQLTALKLLTALNIILVAANIYIYFTS